MQIYSLIFFENQMVSIVVRKTAKESIKKDDIFCKILEQIL